MDLTAGWTKLVLIAGATSAKKPASAGSSSYLIIFLVIIAAAYFLFLRPQQQKARKARDGSASIEVGDEIVTIGGIVGRVLEMDKDRVTLLTGEMAEEGSVPEHAPHRMVILRQAVARKLEPSSPEYDESLATDDELGEDSEDDSGEDENELGDDGIASQGSRDDGDADGGEGVVGKGK